MKRERWRDSKRRFGMTERERMRLHRIGEKASAGSHNRWWYAALYGLSFIPVLPRHGAGRWPAMTKADLWDVRARPRLEKRAAKGGGR